MTVMDGYARVSRVLGRVGDGYMSPTIQREEVERWARGHDVRIGQFLTEEDVSGGKAVKDRRLEELIRRVERGQSSGVIVRSLDRFGRDSLDAAVNIKRLSDAGARLIAVLDGVDTGPGGSSKITLAVQLAIAEDYLDRVRRNWDDTKRRNVEVRGLHVCATPPIGYRRADEADWPGELPVVQRPKDEREAWKLRTTRDARLLVEPREEEAVVLGFKLRADGGTVAQVARAVSDRLERSVSHTTVARMLANRVYLGEARATVAGEQVTKEGAHRAIVTPELFAAVQVASKRRARKANDGSIAAQALLSGLVRCAGCGSNAPIRGKGRDGTAFYSCGKGSAGGCPAPASAACKLVDPYVVWLLQEDHSAVDAAGGVEQEVLEAKARVQTGERELEELVAERGELSLPVWRKMVVAAETELDAARVALYDLPDLDLPDEVVKLDGRFFAYAPWGQDRDADRRTLRKYIGSVTVRACGNNGRWTPISKRCEVRWIDGSAPVLVAADDQPISV